MAYNIYNGVKKLIVDFNGQREETIDNIVSAQFDNAAAGFGSILLSNPYYNYQLSATGYTNWSSSDAVLYAQLEVLHAGTLSLLSLLSEVEAGQYIKIYRKGFPNTYIYATKPSGSVFRGCSVYLYYNGASVGKDFGTTLNTSRESDKYSIGFLYDSTLDKFALYTINISKSWDSGNHGNAITELGGIALSANSAQIANIQAALDILLRDNVTYPDPYEAGGYSTVTDHGTGDFDDISDTIAEPTAPALSAVDSGLITLYGVDRTNIRAFANYLFGSAFDPANFHKLFESPMEAILCLNYMPYTPSSAAATATEISFGAAGTGANGRVIGSQYETIDCGTLDLKEFYGSCLDYSPYTTVTLVLPYASAVDIDPDEFNTKTIGIKYRIDNYTGAGLVLISDGTSVLMQIPCTVANPLPISASNYSSIVSAIANTAIVSAGAILAVATGGVGTGAAIALAGGVAASTAGNVMAAKLHYNHGGAGGMGTGMFGVQKPYLIIKRPRQCLPDGNNSFQGYPTFCTKNLGDVSGFTKVFQIHLDSIPATDAEKKELETILKGGVWF